MCGSGYLEYWSSKKIPTGNLRYIEMRFIQKNMQSGMLINKIPYYFAADTYTRDIMAHFSIASEKNKAKFYIQGR